MSTPQSGATRKQQKARATRKLALWRKKQETKQDASATQSAKAEKTSTK
jgi:hypothetical protein